jgi:phosphate starvation-inducible PhoH-like protein
MARKKTEELKEALTPLAKPRPIKFSSKEFKFSQKQKELIAHTFEENNKIIFISGPAGSSKTYLSVYSALNLMEKNDDLDLLYVRTVIESAEKGLGALPGDVNEKFNPYMAPLADKLEEMISFPLKNELIQRLRIQAMPINYIRGANWINKIVIADEAQNFTFKELTTLITRAGKNTKVFVCGDPMQSDINGKSGFKSMYDLFNDEESSKRGIKCFEFTENDIMRSELLKFIIKKLKTQE